MEDQRKKTTLIFSGGTIVYFRLRHANDVQKLVVRDRVTFVRAHDDAPLVEHGRTVEVGDDPLVRDTQRADQAVVPVTLGSHHAWLAVVARDAASAVKVVRVQRYVVEQSDVLGTNKLPNLKQGKASMRLDRRE